MPEAQVANSLRQGSQLTRQDLGGQRQMSALLIHAVLPQTQCTRCGYPDCLGYANAIATGEVGINQCPPGGQAGIERLAAITGLPVVALNPVNGIEAERKMMFIDENWCIGCTLCIKACPVDAIVGTHKAMHTVLETHCTGCELCLPACPVDCISVEPATPGRTGWAAWGAQEAQSAWVRYETRTSRPRRAPVA